MRSGKVSFVVSVALTLISMLLAVWIGWLFSWSNFSDQQLNASDIAFLAFVGIVIVTNLFSVSVYVRGYRMSNTRTALALLAHTKGIWVALALLFIPPVLWTLSNGLGIIGVGISLILCGFAALANALAQMTLKRLVGTQSSVV